MTHFPLLISFIFIPSLISLSHLQVPSSLHCSLAKENHGSPSSLAKLPIFFINSPRTQPSNFLNFSSTNHSKVSSPSYQTQLIFFLWIRNGLGKLIASLCIHFCSGILGWNPSSFSLSFSGVSSSNFFLKFSLSSSSRQVNMYIYDLICLSFL